MKSSTDPELEAAAIALQANAVDVPIKTPAPTVAEVVAAAQPFVTIVTAVIAAAAPPQVTTQAAAVATTTAPAMGQCHQSYPDGS